MISIRTRAILLTIGILLHSFVVCLAQPGNDNTKSLLENISAAGKRPLLLSLLQHAGMTPILTSEGSYTFLLPSETELLKIEKLPPEVVRNILRYHIIEGKLKEEELKDGSKLKTLQGGTVSVCRKKGKLLINGIPVTLTNLEASNGYSHAIDGILMPK